MRKIELIELVTDFLRGGDGNNEMQGRFHEGVTTKLVESAFNSAIFAVYLEAKNHSEYNLLDPWAREYEISIVNNTVELPYPPLPLPDAMGIRQVVPVQESVPDYASAFAFREVTAHAIFSSLESETVSTKPTYSLQQKTDAGNLDTHILRLRKVPVGCTSVVVFMIVPLERLDDYDHVAIPSGKENMIIESVIQLLANKPPSDNINDNNPMR